MGRILGGIEESDLRDLVTSVLQDVILPHEEEIDKVSKSVAQLEGLLQKDREDASRRLDALADIHSQAGEQHKGEFQEVQDQLDALSSKVDKRHDEFDERIEELIEQRTQFEVMIEEKVLTIGEKLDKAGELRSMEDRIDLLERTLRLKVDAADLEEELAGKHRVLQKMQADMSGSNERVDRLEQQIALMPETSLETPNELHKRLEVLDRRLQEKADRAEQRADREAMDSSLDELDQLVRADFKVFDDRMRKVERDMEQKADAVELERLSDTQADISFVDERLRVLEQEMQQHAPRMLQDVLNESQEAAMCSDIISAGLPGRAGGLHGLPDLDDGDANSLDMPPPPRVAVKPATRKAAGRRGAPNGGKLPPEGKWRPNVILREDPQPGRSSRRGAHSPPAQGQGLSDTSPWGTPRSARTVTPDPVVGMSSARHSGLSSPEYSPGRKSDDGRNSDNSRSPGPRMWRPRRLL